jgi:O-antigen/teichoic acid export membrane protein
MGALSGLEAFTNLAKAGMVSAIVAVTAVFIGAALGGLNGSLFGLSASALLRCVIHNRWLRLECRRQEIKPQYQGSLKHEKHIIYQFALPAAMGNYYSMPLIWLANSFLVRQPGGYGEMALFSAANNLRFLALFLPNVMFNVAVSILNNEKSEGDRIRYNKTFKFNVLCIFLASLGSVIIIGIIGRPILLLFGKDFGGAYYILWFLLVASLFEGLSIALYQFIQTRAKIWLSFFFINIPREAFFVVAAYFLVKSYGGIGLAAAFLASTLLGLIFHFSIVATLYRKEIRTGAFEFTKPEAKPSDSHV